MIKKLAFDPGRSRRKAEDDPHNVYSKVRSSLQYQLTFFNKKKTFVQLAELASCRELDKISLGPRPGGRVRSVVSAPRARGLGNGSPAGGAFGGMVDLDESSDDEVETSAVPS